MSSDNRILQGGELVLAQPRGFCAGVDRAIEIVERALERFGAPVYVRHEIVHNDHVVADLRSKGAVFVDTLDQVPAGAILVFSAHGVPQSVRDEAQDRGFMVFDATCPLVTKVHVEVRKMRAAGLEVVMIGHKGHPEVEGTMGQGDGDGMHLVESVEDVDRLPIPVDQPIAYVTQTTLSVDDAAMVVQALRDRFSSVHEPKKADICYATQNRQDAVKFMSSRVDLVLVVGSPTSSNSTRLREVAIKRGVPAYLVGSAEDVDPAWLHGRQRIGITAGASAPEVLVAGLIERLKGLGATSVQTLPGVEEHVSFPLPKGLG